MTGAASPAMSGARVLVIEDEEDIRRFVRLALVSEGHDVTEASSVQRGLIDAGTRPPDLVVLDLEPPRFSRRLQLLRRWSHEEVEQVLT